MGAVFLFNLTKWLFWIGRTCFLTKNSSKKNVMLDGSSQRWLRIPLVWILYKLQGHRRTEQQWRRGWQVWPALNLLRLLCGLSAPNEALFLLLLKLNTVFDSSLPKPQWSCLKCSLWRRDSLSHGSHICNGRWLSVRGCQHKGGSLFLSASWDEDFAVCAKLRNVNLCSLQCSWAPVPSSSPPIYLEIPAKWFSSIRACSHALVELVLGSNPRGGSSLGKVLCQWQLAFQWNERNYTKALTAGCCAWEAAEYLCSSVHLLQQQSLLLREQDPCTEHFFTQDLLMLFLLLI